jgi:NOL1/NOP2/fmu family ribosome biogenesis protein
VDAPCSGEGMFRKDETARLEWTPEHVKVCADRQEEILSNAAVMLKPGGTIVYSTCTFSPEENEQVIERFLITHPDFSIADAGTRPGLYPGHPEWSKSGMAELKKTLRIWPDKSEGEGHYLAVLKKCEDESSEKKQTMPEYSSDKSVIKEVETFLKELLVNPAPLLLRKEYILFGDQLYLIPPEMVDFKGMKIIRPGLHLGTVKKNRFEPSHGFALFLKKEEVNLSIDLSADGAEIIKYLKGETLSGDISRSLDNKKGWVLVNTDGYSIGFAKLAGGILKNHYPKGLRWM